MNDKRILNRQIFPITSGNQISSVEEMYDTIDLASLKIFAGGFINFGYWKDINLAKEISSENRIKSAVDLYRIILDHININFTDTILDVGCGQGAGTVLTSKTYDPKKIIGIDFSFFQISKAKLFLNNYLPQIDSRIEFIKASAEQLSFETEFFDKIYSIQTAHYFNSFATFCSEAFRVLKPKGKMAIATYFLKHNESLSNLKSMIQTVNSGTEKPITLDQAIMNLQQAGFSNIKVDCIGDYVWQGFDIYVSQFSGFKESWGRNWYTAYLQELVDYYIITVEKN